MKITTPFRQEIPSIKQYLQYLQLLKTTWMQFLFAAFIEFDCSKESFVSELSALTYFKTIFNSFKIYGKEKINAKIKKTIYQSHVDQSCWYLPCQKRPRNELHPCHVLTDYHVLGDDYDHQSMSHILDSGPPPSHRHTLWCSKCVL